MVSDVSDGTGSRREAFRPRWSLLLVAMVAVSPAVDLYQAGTVSWPWLTAGVVAWGLATGPIATTEFGRSVGSWFESIGVLGRLAAIVAFAAATYRFHVTFHPPAVPVDSFVLGGMAGVGLTVCWRWLRSA